MSVGFYIVFVIVTNVFLIFLNTKVTTFFDNHIEELIEDNIEKDYDRSYIKLEMIKKGYMGINLFKHFLYIGILLVINLLSDPDYLMVILNLVALIIFVVVDFNLYKYHKVKAIEYIVRYKKNYIDKEYINEKVKPSNSILTPRSRLGRDSSMYEELTSILNKPSVSDNNKTRALNLLIDIKENKQEKDRISVEENEKTEAILNMIELELKK